MKIVSSENVLCSGSSNNYSFTIGLVCACIGTIALFASSAVLHVITREKEDLRHDMAVKMSICQCLLDIFSGFSLSKYYKMHLKILIQCLKA